MPLSLELPLPGSRPCDVVAVGENSLDLICLCSALPDPDGRAEVVSKGRYPGGQAATAAVGVARLGFKSRYVGAVGDDVAGATVKAGLEREGVEFSIVTRPGVETRSAVILVDRSGRRAVLGSRDPRLDIHEGEIDAAVFTSTRVLLVDGSDLRLARRAAAAAHTAGVLTLVDLDAPSPEALDLLRHIDVVIVPSTFIRSATGLADIEEGLSAFAAETGGRAIVATMGVDGAMVWADGRTGRVKAEPVPVVDTTGAGDAFRAGFAAACLASPTGRPEVIDAVRLAVRVAALNCRAVGAQTALPTAAEAGLFGEGRV